MMWRLRVKACVRRQVRNLFPGSTARIVVWKELLALENQPFPQNSKPLRGNHRAFRIQIGGSLRLEGDRGWRCVYTVNYRSGVVTLWRVAHRDNVYRHLPKRYNPAKGSA